MILKKKMKKYLFMRIEEIEKDNEDELKQIVPLYAKILFPFLSPVYYTLGTPLVSLYSKQISENLLKDIEINDILYQAYFNKIVNSLNKAIDDLNLMRNNFEDNYILEKLREVLFKIIENENDVISSNDFNRFKRIFTELLNKYTNPIEKFNLNGLFDSLTNYYPTENDKNKEKQITKKLKVLFSSIEEMVRSRDQN